MFLTRLAIVAAAACFSVSSAGRAAEFNFRQQEIEKQLGVGYAVSLVDVNGDKKLDIVVVDTNRVLWYENPTWKRRIVIEDQTKKDNVCIAPYDIDGDGQVDFALGADWRPSDTVNSGTIQWLRRGKSLDDKWTVFPIGTEPTVHRMRWADFNGDGRAELIVSPLHGRANRGPDYTGAGVRTLRYQVPEEPTKQESWKPEVINDDLHVSHNLWPIGLGGKNGLLIASFEGVSYVYRSGDGKWERVLLAAGDQQSRPNRGSSEIKTGHATSFGLFLATIEPWHGNAVVVYESSGSLEDDWWRRPWKRHVIDNELRWGHAVWCANLDDDDDDELIVGVRDTLNDQHRSGVRIYDPPGVLPPPPGKGPLNKPQQWGRHLIDPGGVAVEDLAAADLNDDGRIDVVAAGRATKNVRIYWNEAKKQ
jgi:hypothetical protein